VFAFGVIGVWVLRKSSTACRVVSVQFGAGELRGKFLSRQGPGERGSDPVAHSLRSFAPWRIRGLARYQSLTDREALAREFSPENIAANRPIVDREPLTLSLSLRTTVPATSKTNERRIPRHWLQNAERVWVRWCHVSY
jgi:hypothetical protein